ncbi:MAG: DsbA family protein [Rhodospirillaceae bacterium]
MPGVRFFVCLLVGLGAALVGSPCRAEAPALNEVQKAAVENLVHDYLVKNPEVLVEAMGVLRERQAQAETADRRKGLKENRAALLNDPDAPIAGNPDGDVTMIEFFDYGCPYCKSVEKDLETLLKTDGKIKLVLKELPVLGPASEMASKAALAARAQGKYLQFHNILMTTRGQFTEESLMRLARSVGLDTDRLKVDMAGAAVEAALKANHGLAKSLSINGTPAFVVGDEVYPGAMDLAGFKQVVATARKG